MQRNSLLNSAIGLNGATPSRFAIDEFNPPPGWINSGKPEPVSV
jgi:hypothetical protein